MHNRNFKLPVKEQQLRRLFAQGNMQGVFSSIPKTKLHANREEIWTQCIQKVGEDAAVLLLEFGVYQGRSLKFWSRGFKSPSARMHGFDSFTGLPEDWNTKFTKGVFSANGKPPHIEDSRVSFHIGWIQNTLPKFIEQLRANEALPARMPIVVHIDVDLYSAALFILTTLWHFIPEYYVMFDEFGVDENLALSDFQTAYPIQVDFLGHTMNANAALPQQVFGHIKRNEYSPD